MLTWKENRFPYVRQIKAHATGVVLTNKADLSSSVMPTAMCTTTVEEGVLCIQRKTLQNNIVYSKGSYVRM